MHDLDLQNNNKLLKLVILDLLKEGLQCRIDSLIDLNPSLRKHLGDHKLSTYLSCYPEIFRLTNKIITDQLDINRDNELLLFKPNLIVHLNHNWEAYFSVENHCDKLNLNEKITVDDTINTSLISFECELCYQTFHSRNKLFNHLKSNICMVKNALDVQKIASTVATSTTTIINNQVKRQQITNIFEYANISSSQLVLIGIETPDSKLYAKKIIYELISYLHMKQKATYDNHKNSKEYNDKQIPVDTSIYIPLLWITTSSSKFKKHLRMYIRELSMKYLHPNQRFLYDSPQWWELISCQLLKLISIFSTIFEIICVDNNQVKIVTDKSDFNISNIEKNVILLRTTYIHMFMNQNTNELIEYIINNINNNNNANSLPLSNRFQKHIDNESNGMNTNLIHNDIKILAYNSDYHVIVIDKPPSIRMENLIENIQKQFECNLLSPIDISINAELLNENVYTIKPSLSQYRIKSVSRLDQQTSGAVILPLSQLAEQLLTIQFKNRLTRKYYLCLVQGAIQKVPNHNYDDNGSSYGVIDAKLKHIDSSKKTFVHPSGKLATTRYWCLYKFHTSNNNNNNNNNKNHDNNNIYSLHDEPSELRIKDDNSFSLVLCQPLTGRTHQIRVHMAYINHPLIGDKKYNKKKQLLMERNLDLHNDCLNNNLRKDSIEYIYSNSRLMLHSYQLSVCLNDQNINNTITNTIEDDKDKDYIKSKSSLPNDFIDILTILFRNYLISDVEYDKRSHLDDSSFDINQEDSNEVFNIIKEIKNEISQAIDVNNKISETL